MATGPDQVYTWDITYLPTRVRGIFLYAYVILDIWSREIAGWAIHNAEDEQYVKGLFSTIRRKKNLRGAYLHSDNGNPMKAASFTVWLSTLGLLLSFSRPRVKNDNPYSESLFGTMKGTPGSPRFFADIESARAWISEFVHWYNSEHCHWGIGYVTSLQRRTGESSRLFSLRNQTLLTAWRENPGRFPKNGPRLWKERQVVYLNPTPETVEKMAKISP